jgi:hypothetical protein
MEVRRIAWLGVRTERADAMVALMTDVLGPGGLRLWVFERNSGARAFYARHGFAEVTRTDGSGNEEREPDVLLGWPG